MNGTFSTTPQRPELLKGGKYVKERFACGKCVALAKHAFGFGKDRGWLRPFVSVHPVNQKVAGFAQCNH